MTQTSRFQAHHGQGKPLSGRGGNRNEAQRPDLSYLRLIEAKDILVVGAQKLVVLISSLGSEELGDAAGGCITLQGCHIEGWFKQQGAPRVRWRAFAKAITSDLTRVAPTTPGCSKSGIGLSIPQGGGRQSRPDSVGAGLRIRDRYLMVEVLAISGRAKNSLAGRISLKHAKHRADRDKPGWPKEPGFRPILASAVEDLPVLFGALIAVKSPGKLEGFLSLSVSLTKVQKSKPIPEQSQFCDFRAVLTIPNGEEVAARRRAVKEL